MQINVSFNWSPPIKDLTKEANMPKGDQLARQWKWKIIQTIKASWICVCIVSPKTTFLGLNVTYTNL